MACRKAGLRDYRKQRNPPSAVSDALLFATMCMIGLPVEVLASDGSVYSGIFHTASVHNPYAVVLKQARMVKKGNRDGNVVEGSLVETLVIRPEDLVQVVAKGVVLPSNGMTGFFGNDEIGAVGSNGHEESLDREERISAELRDMLDVQGSTVNVPGCETQSTAAVNIPVEENVRGVPMVSSGYSTSLVQRVQEISISDKPSHIATSVTDTSNSNIHVFNSNSVSGLCASSNSYSPIPTKKYSIKESKLNPGAKLFSPSTLHQKPRTPPLVPKGANVPYIPDTHPMAPITAEPESGAIAFSRSSRPLKFVPCNNVATGNGGNDYAPYIQHMTGQMVSRTQPNRYAGQYDNIQTMPTYIQPNPQNVMHGRVNPLVYMHPISSDFARSETVFTPSDPRPLLNPHQMHLLKHQGNASAQALQLCLTPPVIASGAQQYMMTSPHAVSQPLFPVLRPLPVPGPNMYSSTKFA